MVSSKHDKATHMITTANHLLGSPSFTTMHSYKNLIHDTKTAYECTIIKHSYFCK